MSRHGYTITVRTPYVRPSVAQFHRGTLDEARHEAVRWVHNAYAVATHGREKNSDEQREHRARVLSALSIPAAGGIAGHLPGDVVVMVSPR